MSDQKVAVVTGGTRGIGKAVAIAFASQSYSVVVVGTTQSTVDEVVQEIAATGGNAIAVGANVAISSDVDRIMETAIKEFGRVDVLVNNAGITKDGLLLRMKEEEWDSVMNVNLKGAFLCSKGAFKIMSKQRYGRIINISSVVGEMGNPGQANYCASKAGLIGLTKSNAREMAKRNITVNAVAPGFITTDMTEALSEKAREELKAQIPLERLGDVADIANAVLFLAQESSGYITGHVLNVNGGMYM